MLDRVSLGGQLTCSMDMMADHTIKHGGYLLTYPCRSSDTCGAKK